MRASIALAASFAAVVFAAPAVSQLTDGQPQVMTSTSTPYVSPHPHSQLCRSPFQLPFHPKHQDRVFARC